MHLSGKLHSAMSPGVPVTKSLWRRAAAKEFGRNWWKVHPVIKKARMEWAIQVTSRAERVERGSGLAAAQELERWSTLQRPECKGRSGSHEDFGKVHVWEASGKKYTV